MKTLADKALKFAREAHAGQVRKFPDAAGKDVPYITHPIRVATLLSKYMPADMADYSEAMAAAYMHDTIEDCQKTAQDIVAATGSAKASEFVQLLTDRPRGAASRKVRKAETVERMRTAPVAVKMVKAADVLDNLSDGLDKLPIKFLKVYVGEKRALLSGIKAGVTDKAALAMFVDLEAAVESAEALVASLTKVAA